MLSERAKAARREYLRNRSEESKEKRREYMREWRQKNPDKIRQHQETYWERKADELEARARAEMKTRGAGSASEGQPLIFGEPWTQ